MKIQKSFYTTIPSRKLTGQNWSNICEYMYVKQRVRERQTDRQTDRDRDREREREG